MIKECRSFAGMVNFVSIFCPELQGLLKPIYDLTKEGDTLFGEKNRMRPLKKLKVDYKDLQFYTYQTDKDDSSCIQTQVSLPLVVHYTKFRMASLDLLTTQVKECQIQLRIIQLQNWKCVAW